MFTKADYTKFVDAYIALSFKRGYIRVVQNKIKKTVLKTV